MYRENMNKMGATACDSCEEDSEKVYRLKKLWEVSDGQLKTCPG